MPFEFDIRKIINYKEKIPQIEKIRQGVQTRFVIIAIAFGVGAMLNFVLKWIGI